MSFCPVLPLLYSILVLPCRVYKSDLWVKGTQHTHQMIIIDRGADCVRIDPAELRAAELVFVIQPRQQLTEASDPGLESSFGSWQMLNRSPNINLCVDKGASSCVEVLQFHGQRRIT